MATLTLFDAFFEDIAEKVHNLGSDQLIIAMTAAANAPVAATDDQLSDLTEITYTNLSSRSITTTSSAQTSGTYKLVLTDLILSASGGAVGPFRYLVIYNDTATNDELVGFYDNGSEYTIADGDSFTIDFDATNGALTLAAA